jgi:FlaA1/EpsC-like NDP-sugar epimerase
MNELKLDGHGYPTSERLGFFENKRICVFGGTGTIGSLIIEYLKTQKPSVIRVFSNDENSLWESQRKLGYDSNMRYLLGDIRDLDRCITALKGIDYVFNAAAIKHVPFAEYNPLEAVRTNIIGLDNIINACVYRNVKKLLHISTDKAVRPSTVMGASKQIGERILQMRWAQNPEIKMVCVRLGNVWNSRGSIIPLIRECKKQEKPIPITHKNMTRFFMQPEEVIDFIMESFREGGDGEIFIPKLKVVKLLDIMQGEVGIEYPFEEIGIRRGEKLEEELISEEELRFAEECDKKWILKSNFKYIS